MECATQEEVDYFWERLSADPKAEQCGWLKDRSGRVMQAMLQMKKIDIAGLTRAREG